MKLRFLTKYRFGLLLNLLVFSWFCSYSQIFFQKIPKNNQVLQRNDQNEANILIKGIVTEKNAASVSLKIFKDEVLFSESTISLAASLNFEFSTKIKSGKYNYTAKIYLNETREIKSITRIAAGDLFLIYGQSNALGNAGIETYFPVKNPLIRYFRTFNFDTGEGDWFVPHETFLWPSIGALELANFLSNKYEYPIGIIESSVGGAYIKSLNDRTSANPANKNNIYGRMLLQTDFADVRNQIKYLIYRQGESDGFSKEDSKIYPLAFEKLYNYLNIDFPSLSKIYNIQSNILTEENEEAGFLRDFQRKTKYLLPKISTMSTVGTVEYEGLHYRLAGYKQSAFELSRIIGKEIYSDALSEEIYSPDLKKACWENNKIVLEFDKSMKMIYPKDTTINGFTYKMNDFIFVDGKSNVITSGQAIDNKIVLTVANYENTKTISYLPSWFSKPTNGFYEGVHLQNSLGMRAFSFDKVEILGQESLILPIPTITASGFTTICEGDSVILTTTQGYDEYKWYKNDVFLNNNSKTLVIKQNGVFTVQGIKFGKTSLSINSITVQVNPTPTKPKIIIDEQPDKFLLTSSETTNNQWFLNGKIINNAKNQTVIPLEIGEYSVIITQNGCQNTSDISTIKIDKPSLKLGETKTLCNNDSAKIIATIGFGDYIFANGKEEITKTKNEHFVKKSGYYTVTTRRGLIKSPKSDSIYIKFNPTPLKPTLTLENSALKSSSSTNNQWSIDGKILKDSVGQYLQKIGFGTYAVRVIENGCASESAQISITASEPLDLNLKVKLYPNANNGTFWIELPLNNQPWKIDVFDIEGKIILSEFYKSTSGNKQNISIKQKSGFYILKATSGSFNQTINFIIEN